MQPLDDYVGKKIIADLSEIPSIDAPQLSLSRRPTKGTGRQSPIT
jgi:hypothetical protein